MADKRKAALGFIFITLLIDVTGVGIIIPVMPKLIQQLTGGGLSTASTYGGWLMASYAVMQFVCAPIVGGLSDRYGRRPMILLSLLGLGVDYIFLSLAPTIGWLFVGRIFAGLFGASFTTASAYIADISKPEERAQNFGIIGAAFGMGFIIGPSLGGIVSQFGPRVPFMLSAVFSLANLAYGFFILPESLAKENRRAFSIQRANPVGSLVHLQKYPAILGLVASIVLIYLASQATQSTWTYYTILKFKWNEQWVGYSLAAVGLMVGLVQGLLIRVVIPKIGQINSVFIGLSLSIIGFTLFGLATEGWMMFAFMVPFALGGIAGPSIQGLVSAQVPANEQGELQGALTSLMSLTSIFGPLLMTGLFSYYTAKEAPVYLPGASFFAAACLMLLSLLIAIRVLAVKQAVV